MGHCHGDSSSKADPFVSIEIIRTAFARHPAFASWTRYQSWLWQDPGHQFGGEQETSSLREAIELYQTMGHVGSGAFSSSFFALYTAVEGNQGQRRSAVSGP